MTYYHKCITSHNKYISTVIEEKIQMSGASFVVNISKQLTKSERQQLNVNTVLYADSNVELDFT